MSCAEKDCELGFVRGVIGCFFANNTLPPTPIECERRVVGRVVAGGLEGSVGGSIVCGQRVRLGLS